MVAMKSRLLVLVLSAIAFGASRGNAVDSKEPSTVSRIPVKLERLVRAYPGRLCGASSNELKWCDGTTMLWDDGREKDFAQKLASPDLEDQMSLDYPRQWSPVWPVDFDPGRIRYQPFFDKMYAASAKAVSAKLKKIIWLPGIANKRVMVTSVNGVDKKMEIISREISNLPIRTATKVAGVSGTFVWRKIKGTTRPSMHSYGIAIDIGKDYSDYWKWNRPGPDGKYVNKNRFPIEVVKIFESHGFIWGGKWYHYDTMHFEYRPELLIP
jgi:peptidoglycan LD-endopeptidase CwlK